MEQQNRLGIYISGNSATAIILSHHGTRPSVLGCFTVSAETSEDEPPQSLGQLIAEGVASRGLKVDEVSAAIDCSSYTQHNLHSEFTDPKQIANTIRFDAEEALATDAANFAITSSITSTSDIGACVTTFTTDREALSAVLTDLQANRLDPIAIEPDAICIARSLHQSLSADEFESSIFAVFSNGSCYLIMPTNPPNAPIVRSFLVDPSLDRTGVLAREIPITMASLPADAPQKTALIIADGEEPIDCESLAEKLDLQVRKRNLLETVNINPSQLSEGTTDAAAAIAYSAALHEIDKSIRSDFRQDFMPYQGRKIIIQKTLRNICISISVILICLGMYFQIKLDGKKNDLAEITNIINTAYSDVMFGTSYKGKEIVKKLDGVFRKLEREKKGVGFGDEKSATAKLSFVLEALNNKILKNINYEIDTITITAKQMTVIGSTASKAHTLKLFNAFDRHPKLKRAQHRTKLKGGRDTFTLMLEPKQ